MYYSLSIIILVCMKMEWAFCEKDVHDIITGLLLSVLTSVSVELSCTMS